MSRLADTEFWVNAHERPRCFGEIERMFVDAGLCDWSATTAPPPQDYALITLACFGMMLREYSIRENDE